VEKCPELTSWIYEVASSRIIPLIGETRMAECDWSILCDYAFLDSGNKQCLIGAFDRIYAPTVPILLPKASVALKILGDPGERVRFRIEIIRPVGTQLLGADGNTLIADSGTADVQFNLVNTGLPDYGVYSVNIYVNGELSRAITFQVTTPPQTTPPPQQG
jgi:hypothetical protein